MEQDFYKNIIINNGIDVLIPDEEDRIIVNNTILMNFVLELYLNLQRKLSYLL
ncbi:hypothetical protein NMZ80_13930 [Clostridioides difficile]|uniref:hypothetical protein n=1 Tax=Clostridioides difficile TaxID=1496 RepID=UPI0021C34700|nr:hypothetical protein [Clostridioides difficile]UUC40965.1 hypothetical protein NMZ80_13930 [Clostridioides difficile]